MKKSIGFEGFNLSANLLEAVEKKGFEEPTPIQKEIIPRLLKNEKGYVGGGAVVYQLLVLAGKADFTHEDWMEYVKYLEEAMATVPDDLSYPSTLDTLKLIKKHKGIPVLAHPYQEEEEYCIPLPVVDELISKGIQGIEIMGSMNPSDHPYVQEIKNKARAHKLIMTGGSDTHNINKRCEMGQGTFEYNGELLKLKKNINS